MSLTRNPESPEVAVIYERQFALAVELSEGQSWTYGSDESDYYFGGHTPTGLAALNLLRDAPTAKPTLLDIGAGDGRFLRRAKRYSREEFRAVGLTAIQVAAELAEDDPIEWVYGDFVRPQTWQPAELLAPGSVDLAVASLAFRHFADPVRSIQNALGLLRPNGHLLTDSMVIRLSPETADQAVEVIEADLSDNQGEYGFTLAYDDRDRAAPAVVLSGVHLQRKTAETLTALKPMVERHHIIYGLAS